MVKTKEEVALLQTKYQSLSDEEISKLADIYLEASTDEVFLSEVLPRSDDYYAYYTKLSERIRIRDTLSDDELIGMMALHRFLSKSQ